MMQNGDSFGQLMIQEKELKIKSNLLFFIYIVLIHQDLDQKMYQDLVKEWNNGVK